MVKAFVWSVALYGSETWTLQKEDIRRLEAFEIWIWKYHGLSTKQMKRYCRWWRHEEKQWTPLEVDRRDG